MQPSFAHLLRLSDDTGLFEHALGSTPLRSHGYCVDDVARGLMVICREPSPPPALRQLAGRYLSFLAHAQLPDGTFYNRLGYDRRWFGPTECGDWWGRALHGLGTAAARAPEGWMRQDASTLFDRACRHRSAWPRAMAFAGLGAAEVLTVTPGHEGAQALLVDAVTTVGQPGRDPAWPWPQPRLAYANAILAEVHLASGQLLHDQRAVDAGLAMLGWLLERETHDGHFSPVPVGGWERGQPQPGFDQQPIEAAAIADACARAWSITAQPRWIEGLHLAVGWFLGNNDTSTELLDHHTGGCADGLGPAECSRNQGAESTLALLSTLQHARVRSGLSHVR